MHLFSLVLELSLPSRSLKGKRGIVKSVMARARQRFNVTAAEVDLADDPETAVLAFAALSGSKMLARTLLERLEEWLADERPDVTIVSADYEER